MAAAPTVLALAHPSQRVREGAADAIVRAGGPEVAHATALLIGHADIPVRTLAARVLARLGADAVDALEPALGDPAPAVRKLAVDTLAGLPAGRLAPRIGALLRDPDANVRLAAVDALGALGAAPFADALVALYHAEPLARARVIAALGASGAAPAALVLGAVADADPVVRLAAAEALGALDVDAAPVLTRALRDVEAPARSVLLDALVRWAEAHADRADALAGLDGDLLAMLGDPEPAYRLAAARGLRLVAGRVCPAALLAHAGAHDDLDAALFAVLAARPDPFGALVEAGPALPYAAGATFAVALVAEGHVAADQVPDAARFVEARFGALDADTKVAVLTLCAAGGPGPLACVVRRGLDDPDPAVAAAARDLSRPSRQFAPCPTP